MEHGLTIDPAAPAKAPLDPQTRLELPRFARRPQRPLILIIDSTNSSRHLLQGMLRTEGYEFAHATEVQQAANLLRERAVDLIIIDLASPGLNPLELCRRFKENHRTRLVPIVLVTNVQGSHNEVAGIESGADEFLTRPLHPGVVKARIRSMLRQKFAVDSLEEAESILFALAQVIEQRDKSTCSHCERLAGLSVRLGKALGLPEEDLRTLYRGGFLHDIGKVGIPDAILFKPGRLTVEEWQVMRGHTTKGEEICQSVRSMAPVLPIIRSHHERWDGSGYPDGLRGPEIPLLARILQIADIFDALTTARPYKPAMTPEQAVAVLEQEAARGWRDRQLVEIFRDLRSHTGDDMSASLDNLAHALDESRA